MIDVIFSSSVSADQADRLLRDELKRAIAYTTPKGDILANAWLKKSTTDEERIPLKDGSTYLIYVAKTGKVESEKSSVPAATAGRTIHVKIDVDLEKGTDGRVRVAGTTNLPDHMELMVSLRNHSIKYAAQDTTSVKAGRFETAWFSHKGAAIPAGTYEIAVSSPLPALQPASVKKIIGDKGQNLAGNNTESSLGSKLVAVTVPLEKPAYCVAASFIVPASQDLHSRGSLMSYCPLLSRGSRDNVPNRGYYRPTG